MAILDETDSGLDIDALKIVANGVNTLRNKKRSFLIITHYQRLLDFPNVLGNFCHSWSCRYMIMYILYSYSTVKSVCLEF